MRRTEHQWLTLFKTQSDSNLSVKNFCVEQCISTSCFYKHKATLLTQQAIQPSPFYQVQLIEPNAAVSSQTINLYLGKVSMELDAATDTRWLASLVAQLA